MSFPVDIDPIPIFSADSTLVVAQHFTLHTQILRPGGPDPGLPRPGPRVGAGWDPAAAGEDGGSHHRHPGRPDRQRPGAGGDDHRLRRSHGTHWLAPVRRLRAWVLGAQDRPGLCGRSWRCQRRDARPPGPVHPWEGGSLPASGGAQQVTLTAAQSGMPSHAHAASSGSAGVDHLHGFETSWMNHNVVHAHSAWTGNDGGHGHNAAYANNWQGSTQDQNPAGTDYGPIGNNPANLAATSTAGPHAHGVGIGNSDINHTHSGTDGRDGPVGCPCPRCDRQRGGSGERLRGRQHHESVLRAGLPDQEVRRWATGPAHGGHRGFIRRRCKVRRPWRATLSLG